MWVNWAEDTVRLEGRGSSATTGTQSHTSQLLPIEPIKSHHLYLYSISYNQKWRTPIEGISGSGGVQGSDCSRSHRTTRSVSLWWSAINKPVGGAAAHQPVWDLTCQRDKQPRKRPQESNHDDQTISAPSSAPLLSPYMSRSYRK